MKFWNRFSFPLGKLQFSNSGKADVKFVICRKVTIEVSFSGENFNSRYYWLFLCSLIVGHFEVTPGVKRPFPSPRLDVSLWGGLSPCPFIPSVGHVVANELQVPDTLIKPSRLLFFSRTINISKNVLLEKNFLEDNFLNI